MMLRSVEAELVKAAAITLCGTVLDAVLTWWMTVRPSGGLSRTAKRSAYESNQTPWSSRSGRGPTGRPALVRAAHTLGKGILLQRAPSAAAPLGQALHEGASPWPPSFRVGAGRI